MQWLCNVLPWIQSKRRYFPYWPQKIGSLPFLHRNWRVHNRENAQGSDLHSIQHPTHRGVEILLIASCYWNRRQTPAWWATWLLRRFYLFYHYLFCSRFFFSFFPIQGPVRSSKHTRRLHGCGNNCILMDTVVIGAPIRKQSLEFDLDTAHLECFWWEVKVLSSISATLLVNITVTDWALATLSKVLFNLETVNE